MEARVWEGRDWQADGPRDEADGEADDAGGGDAAPRVRQFLQVGVGGGWIWGMKSQSREWRRMLRCSGCRFKKRRC